MFYKLEMFCHILHNMPLPHCSCQYVYFVCVPAFISWLYCWHVSQACIWPISCGGEVSCSFQAVFQSFTLFKNPLVRGSMHSDGETDTLTAAGCPGIAWEHCWLATLAACVVCDDCAAVWLTSAMFTRSFTLMIINIMM